MINAETLNDSVEVERDFTPGPFGQIHVRIARPKRTTAYRTPLVLFPPTPHSSNYFKPYMANMATDRVVVAIDTPGYGDSARAEKLLSIQDFATSGLAAIKALGMAESPFDLLGYHTGGLIACETAILSPTSVRRLVLPGFPYFIEQERQLKYNQYALPDEIHADGSHLLRKWEYSKMPLEAGVSLERIQEHFTDLMKSYPETWRAFHAVFTYPSESQIPKITQPVLLISVAGSLKEETAAAMSVFHDAKYIALDDFTFGVFDLGADALALNSRKFLD